MTDDTISRRAAIEALGEEPLVWHDDDAEVAERNQWRRDVAAIKALLPVQPEQRWIPVTERLPEEEKDVLVTRHFLSDKHLKKNAITESFYVEVASYMDDEWTSYSDEYKIKRHLHKVIAWMPLPKAWKGEEECLKTK